MLGASRAHRRPQSSVKRRSNRVDRRSSSIGSMDAILEGLNLAQREAVTHDAGPLLIVAGAGTGKTTVITRRIAWLIARKKARPEEILALTFTDKAAAEMEERVDTLVPYGYADVTIATFHAFGDRLMRENALEIGLTPDFRVLNRAEQLIFFRDRLFQFALSHYRPLGDPTRHIQAIISVFSRAKDEDVSPEAWVAYAEELLAGSVAERDNEELHDRAMQQMELARTYAQYQKLMAEAGTVDFGDQIVYALRLFRTRPYVLNSYQRRFRYILVDEFQDTNYGATREPGRRRRRRPMPPAGRARRDPLRPAPDRIDPGR